MISEKEMGFDPPMSTADHAIHLIETGNIHFRDRYGLAFMTCKFIDPEFEYREPDHHVENDVIYVDISKRWFREWGVALYRQNVYLPVTKDQRRRFRLAYYKFVEVEKQRRLQESKDYEKQQEALLWYP